LGSLESGILNLPIQIHIQIQWRSGGGMIELGYNPRNLLWTWSMYFFCPVLKITMGYQI